MKKASKKRTEKATGIFELKTGEVVFSKSQSKLRFQMCKEALGSPAYKIKFKYCYEDLEEMQSHACGAFVSHEVFDSIYHSTDSLGWRSKFYDYSNEACVEGSFFPFIRSKGKVSNLVDTGCIWIGARNSYPRIFVDNTFCRWYFPIDSAGNIVTKAFLPYRDAVNYSSYLTNDLIISMLEGDALEC